MKAVSANSAEESADTAAPATTTAEGDQSGASASEPQNQPDASPQAGEKQVETISQLRARHLKETKEHKKQMDKLGKKQKDEISKRTNELQQRHAAELAQLKKSVTEDDDSDGDGNGKEPAEASADSAQEATQDFSGLTLYGGEKKISKSQRKKQARAAQEAEREERIRAEQEAMGPTERALEESALLGLLTPLNLTIREIAADGHCMYRALSDQLQLCADGQPPGDDYLGLRLLAAKYMREHADEYMPFVVQDPEDDEDQHKQFEEFCHEVEATASWGGQVELGALANALQRHIAVYSTDLGKLDMGLEFAGKKETLNVCYMKHAYGLGEHYNSIGRTADADQAVTLPADA